MTLTFGKRRSVFDFSKVKTGGMGYGKEIFGKSWWGCTFGRSLCAVKKQETRRRPVKLLAELRAGRARDINERPPRLPLRWAVILGFASVLIVVLSVAVSPVVGIPAGLAAVGLLDQILE